MSMIKAKLEAIIYAAEEPVTLEQITALVKDAVGQQITTERARDVDAGAAGAPEAAQAERAVESAQPEPVAQLEAQTEAELAQAEAAADPESAPSESVAEADAQPEAAAEPLAPPSPTDAEIKAYVRHALEELTADYASAGRGMEIRQIAGGYRMATKPEHHDLVRTFARSLKPPIKLSLPALETLAVIAYKQPVTAPEITEIRGVDCGGVLGTLLQRKLITTAGRKAVIGRPMLYKTTKEFLLRFGLKDVNELPSIEEFEKLAQEALGPDLFSEAAAAPEVQAATSDEEQAPADVERAQTLNSLAESQGMASGTTPSARATQARATEGATANESQDE